MTRQIKLIYQDCPMCGARESWGEAQTKIADTHGFEIVKTPFYSKGAHGLIMKALEKGIGQMPFFTDGGKFAYSLDDFVEKPKPRRHAKKSKEEHGD